MAEVHVNITTNNSGNQVVFHNPGQAPTMAGAGVAVTSAPKSSGQTNGVVHGQVPGTSVLIHNPA